MEIEQGEAKVIGPLSSKEINDGFINVDIITEKVLHLHSRTVGFTNYLCY